MQATHTPRWLSPVQIAGAALVVVLLGGLALGAATRDLTDRKSVTGPSESRSVAAPQITSDEIYALEMDQAFAQVNGWHAVPQLTSDEAWSLEQSMLSSAASGADATSLNLDRDGADIVTTPHRASPDITGLNLDRDGADIP